MSARASSRPSSRALARAVSSTRRGRRRGCVLEAVARETRDDEERATFGSREADKVLETRTAENGGVTRAVVFSTTAAVDVGAVERLSEAVGWPERPRAKIRRALENSFMVATLYECDVDAQSGKVQETSRGKLIACARATSDHVFNATLWDIIVDPEYQGRGYGKALVQQMIRALLSRDVANVTLFADEDVVPFYRALGFVSDLDGIKGMFLTSE
ncbi:Acyl-CoA N-acyltransferase [Ostreococcus tauri]|uniref:Acyl-CoA N-acyltransferase n=1 Tax=Ostreococcus tauri TaxID=70448 RepID=A0A096PBC8_OSTTA|nr:Acyl-CoA N-acyltransferase [Ostreococcus tauri]CEG01952.1 Acyl-CoA N-acyltransferase [Ostreococcus tauri]|eukprot:XP_022841270.1 Acyl-CoA N-acyltransferase [Ostreococcus tauri]